MDGSLLYLNNHGIMDREQEEEDLGSMSAFSDDGGGGDSGDDSSGSSTPASSDAGLEDQEGCLYDMSSLMAQLPLKRGLSKFYQGKSQSFTSLASAQSLQDLPKPDTVSCKNRKQRQVHGCRSGHGHCSGGVHPSIYSKAIAKAKMRPPRAGNLMCCSSSVPAAAKSRLQQPVRRAGRGASHSRTLLFA